MKIVFFKKFVYENKILNFISDYKKILKYYETLMSKEHIISKNEFNNAISRIMNTLMDIKVLRIRYRQTKDKRFKKRIKEDMKIIKKEQRLLSNIIDMNRNYYLVIYNNHMSMLNKQKGR